MGIYKTYLKEFENILSAKNPSININIDIIVLTVSESE